MFRARRPFHPMRLMNFITKDMGVVRSDDDNNDNNDNEEEEKENGDAR